MYILVWVFWRKPNFVNLWHQKRVSNYNSGDCWLLIIYYFWSLNNIKRVNLKHINLLHPTRAMWHDIAQMMKPEALSLHKYAFLFFETARGLEHIHGLDIIHGNINKDNFFFKKGWQNIRNFSIWWFSNYNSASPSVDGSLSAEGSG